MTKQELYDWVRENYRVLEIINLDEGSSASVQRILYHFDTFIMQTFQDLNNKKLIGLEIYAGCAALDCATTQRWLQEQLKAQEAV